jgi:hypothetical protein
MVLTASATLCNTRELYAQVGMSAIPKILGLLDRHRLSPTYGCFDKNFWHYKTASFPTGMSQEFVLPLALVYLKPLPGGEAYYHQENLKEWVRAGIHYASRSAHRDGSCDDYFPYERALGAVAFSLYACTESALLLQLRDATIETFLIKRGRWLIHHEEAGILANHHALAVLALYNVYLLSGQAVFLQAAQQRLTRLLSWQSAEGWFPEYEGCDPGYHTATIDFLAKYYRKSADTQVLESLRRAVHFAADFLHPDGSYGGTYGSRNTALFFPHGFELLGTHMPAATWIADAYLQGVRAGKRVFLEDDRLIGHLTYNHLQACIDFYPQRQPAPAVSKRVQFWQGAGLYVRRQDDLYAVLAVAKGGVSIFFRGTRLLYADSGLIARCHDGRCLVTHLVDHYEHEVGDHTVRIQGYFGYAKQRVPTPLTMLIFHAGMMTLGRWWSNGIRALLQKLLIVGKRPTALRFQRTVQFYPDVTITDEIWDERPRRRGSHGLTALYAGTDHTSIYVAMSNAYQATCLLPWTDLSAYVEELQRTGHVQIIRPVHGQNSAGRPGEQA